MVLRSLSRYREAGLLILRVGIGATIVVHSFMKLRAGGTVLEAVGGSMRNFGIDFGFYWWGLAAALAEMIGGLLLVLGLFFRVGAILIIGVMAVALMHHYNRGDGFSGYAHALKVFIVAFSMLLLGPGKYSIDRE